MTAKEWQGKWIAKVGGNKGSLKGKISRTRRVKYITCLQIEINSMKK